MHHSMACFAPHWPRMPQEKLYSLSGLESATMCRISFSCTWALCSFCSAWNNFGETMGHTQGHSLEIQVQTTKPAEPQRTPNTKHGSSNVCWFSFTREFARPNFHLAWVYLIFPPVNWEECSCSPKGYFVWWEKFIQQFSTKNASGLSITTTEGSRNEDCKQLSLSCNAAELSQQSTVHPKSSLESFLPNKPQLICIAVL